MTSVHKADKKINKKSKQYLSKDLEGNKTPQDKSKVVKDESKIVKEEPKVEVYDSNQRKKVHDMLLDLGNILSNSDWSKLDDFLEPKAVLNRLNEEIIGRISIQAFLEKKNIGELKYFFVRYYYDSDKMTVCSEWVTRRKKGNDQYYHEKLVVWFMKLSKEAKIKTWYIWRDPFYSNFIESDSEPISDKCWMPDRKPVKKYTASELCDFVRKKFAYLETADFDAWGETLHKDLQVRPPWRAQVAKVDCMQGLKKFLNDFEDINASILEILYDYTQPNVAAYIQLFSATKKDTKEKCEDIDLSIIRLEDDQVISWRCYFYEKDIPKNHFSFKDFIKDVLEESLKNRSINESDK